MMRQSESARPHGHSAMRVARLWHCISSCEQILGFTCLGLQCCKPHSSSVLNAFRILFGWSCCVCDQIDFHRCIGWRPYGFDITVAYGRPLNSWGPHQGSSDATHNVLTFTPPTRRDHPFSRCPRCEGCVNVLTALCALTCRISPIAIAQLCDIVAYGSYGSSWLRNLQVVRLCSVCIMAVLTVFGSPAVQGTAVERSARQKQRRYRVDQPLPMRPRESANDCSR